MPRSTPTRSPISEMAAGIRLGPLGIEGFAAWTRGFLGSSVELWLPDTRAGEVALIILP